MLAIIHYFTALWAIKNEEMVKNSKKKYIFNVFYGFSKIQKYTCIFENNFQNIAISSLFIAQSAVKFWIIANIHEMLFSHDYFYNFVRKVPKFKPKKRAFWWKMAIFANLRHEVQGLKFVKSAQNFMCSCFSCIEKDMDIGRKFLETFFKNGYLY